MFSVNACINLCIIRDKDDEKKAFKKEQGQRGARPIARRRERRHQKRAPSHSLLLLLLLRGITRSRKEEDEEKEDDDDDTTTTYIKITFGRRVAVPLPIAFSTRHRIRIVRRISSASARVPATRPVFEVARCCCWWWSCHLLHSSRTSSSRVCVNV